MSDTESENPETTPEAESSASIAPEESSGDAHLDKILEEGILKGQARPELAQLLMAAFMVFALGWLAYTSTLRADFFIEDELAIVANENLQRIPTISRAWGDGISPIAALTFAIDWTVGGGSPIPFRITQLLLHLGCAVLVFLYVREAAAKKRETEAAAMAGGLFFALVPTGMATVTAFAERDVLLSVFFLMLGSLLMLRASRSKPLGLTTFVLSICMGLLAISCGVGPHIVGAIIASSYSRKSVMEKLGLFGAFALLVFLPGLQTRDLVFVRESTLLSYFGIGVVGSIVVTLVLTFMPAAKLRAAIGASLAALLVAFALMTNMQAAERQDEEFYWTQRSDAAPSEFEPKLKLAMIYERQADRLEDRAAAEPLDASDDSLLTQSLRLAAGYYGDARRIQDDLDGHLAEYARMLDRNEETAQAIEVMRDAIAADPQNAENLRAIAAWQAYLYTEMSDVQLLRSALDYYDALDGLDATSERDRLTRAECFLRLGLAREAIDQLRLIRDQDVLRDAQPIIKQVQPRMTRIRDHESAFNQAAQEQKPFAELLRPRLAQLLAEGYILRARYTAEELYRATNGTNGEDWVQLATLYAGMGNVDGLKANWPPPATLSNPWDAVAEELARQKNYNAAFSLLEGQGDRAAALETLGGIAREQGDVQTAVSMYGRVANEFPNRKTAWLALAEIAIEQGQTQGLNETLSRAAAAGATELEIEVLREKAGIEDSVRDQLQPSIIR